MVICSVLLILMQSKQKRINKKTVLFSKETVFLSIRSKYVIVMNKFQHQSEYKESSQWRRTQSLMLQSLKMLMQNSF